MQWCLIVCILKALARHDDTAVDLILRIEKMYVAGRADQLVPLFAKFNHFAVQILQILPGVD